MVNGKNNLTKTASKDCQREEHPVVTQDDLIKEN